MAEFKTKFDLGQEVYHITGMLYPTDIDNIRNLDKLIKQKIDKFKITRVSITDDKHVFYDTYDVFRGNNDMYREEDCYETIEEAIAVLKDYLKKDLEYWLSFFKDV